MKQDLQEKLIKKYPELFVGTSKSITESMMAFGLECGDGWYDLIDEMCQKIEDYVAEHHPEHPVEFFQIKEKYGELRVYVGSASEGVFDIIEEAESKSTSICEQCGRTGVIRDGRYGWIATLCKDGTGCRVGYHK